MSKSVSPLQHHRAKSTSLTAADSEPPDNTKPHQSSPETLAGRPRPPGVCLRPELPPIPPANNTTARIAATTSTGVQDRNLRGLAQCPLVITGRPLRETVSVTAEAAAAGGEPGPLR
jgi:hypothetical protein